ncbi:MAG: PIN domain-containing protein [Methylococcales bacterium]
MKIDKSFIDTNILLYLLSEDHAKADQAEVVISKGGIISVQVLNEFSSVASRKLKMTYSEIREILQTVRTVCKIMSLSSDTHELGLDIAERYGFSIYDSMIVSSALQAGCNILYTEDMQQGQRINEQLLITNPFL